MNSSGDACLLDQRQVLRMKLHAQRELIARQLGPEPAVFGDEYPRSMTMRFLQQRPGVAGKVLAGAASLLVGAGGKAVLNTGLTLAAIAHAAVLHRRRAAAAARRDGSDSTGLSGVVSGW